MKYILDFYPKRLLYFGMFKQQHPFGSGIVALVASLLSFFPLNANPSQNDVETVVFPTTGLLPKEEIGALEFLKSHPEADGRGVIVAILDTGVDPGAPGLSKTTTGEPKLLAVIDATGSGDVQTTTLQKLSKDGTLEGLTGRTLTVDKKWKNPTGEFRLGMAAGYNLFPDELIERLREERQEDWDASQRELERSLQAKLESYKEDHPNAKGAEAEELENLKKLLEAAVAFRDNYVDPGPIYDCVVFHDGENWRSVVDTDADGNLDDEVALANFDVEHKYGTFGDDSLLNFAVNVYDNGDLLSIVADTGMHGTHVAGIVGAYFEDQPELNGVAPGAQIVSIKIGDTRLGGMETPHAMSRAVNAIKKYNCDMVNQSYGEAIRFPQGGNIIKQLVSLVDDHNVVYVSSAGNDGPSLTTVGAPGGTTSSIIGVGATITPNLMKSAYSILKDLPMTQFTWSSRGPTIDGDLGVDISAPGGAISPVPRWELSKNMRANGTSMAGPDACGGLALVLSALKQENKPYSATWVKRAATHTATTIPGVDVFGQGHGMLQVGAAYDLLAGLTEEVMDTPRFEIEVGNDGNRGVYLRNGNLSAEKQTFTVNVKAKFPEDTDNETKANFEARYILKSKEAWVSAPDFAFVNSLDKRFDIQVETMDLEPGAHYTEVVALDAKHPEAGPIFRIPVTVVKPTPLESTIWEKEETLNPGDISRHFFQVPSGATWAELEIKAPEVIEPILLVVHPQHIIPGERYVNVGASYYVRVAKDRPQHLVFPTMEGATMELTFAQYWPELETADYQYELKFHGLKTELGDGVYAQGEKGEEFRVVSLLEDSVLKPSASFTELNRTIAAQSATINVMEGDRDRLDKDGEAYHELVLEYPFTLEAATEVTPLFGLLNDKIYEVEFESQLQMIFDANKQLVATNDTFPDPISLEKGDYVLRLQLRHKERQALEELKSMNLTLALALESAISVDTYGVTDDALKTSGASGSGRLKVNTRSPLVVAEPSADDIPSFAKAGDRLSGELLLQAEAPEGISLQWVFAGQSFKDESEDSAEIESKEATVEEAVEDALLKVAAKYREAEDKGSFDKVMDDHLKTAPNTLNVALERMRWFVDTDKAGESSSQIRKLGQEVIKLIDELEVARYFGLNHQIKDTESKTLDESMEQQKAALIEAYGAIALAEAKMRSDSDTLEKAVQNLKAWTSFDDIDLRIKKALFERRGHTGELMFYYDKALQDDITDKDSYLARLELLKQLGTEWGHLVRYEQDWYLRKFPADYADF